MNSLGIPVAEPPEVAASALPAPVEPIPGQDIHVSIDVELQRVAAKAFGSVSFGDVSAPDYLGRRAGGLVAMEVKTGRILAMVSVPSIDPNEWEHPISRATYQSWATSPFKPFIDKAVQENYFPGSTYKVVSALSMLSDSAYDPDEIIECGRYVEYGGRKFRDTHACGPVDLEDAIVQSCNVYFYRLAMERGLTLSKMEATARALGLGEPTGLGINSEAAGTVPTEASEIRQGSFQQGVRLNSAIGQGNVKVTVLQIAVLYAAIANGGSVVTPSLVDRIETRDGKLVFENTPRLRDASPAMESFDRERIHRGLVGVVNDGKGTAFSERIPGITVAGKTGTAQVGRERRREGEQEILGWDTTQDHAWFAAYAPAEDPEIVVVALVAHGGAEGAAAPIVMRVIGDSLGGARGLGIERCPRHAAPQYRRRSLAPRRPAMSAEQPGTQWWSRASLRPDWTLTIMVGLLATVALINLNSAGGGDWTGLVRSQLAFVVVGTVGMLAVSMIDYRLLFRLGYPIYGVGVALVLMVSVVGVTTNSAERWLRLGALTFQPSEPMKLFLVLGVARYLQELSERPAARGLRGLLVPGIMTAVPAALIVKQPDPAPRWCSP